jgi:hypothetical protein
MLHPNINTNKKSIREGYYSHLVKVQVLDSRVWQGCHTFPITTGCRVWGIKTFAYFWSVKSRIQPTQSHLNF